MRRPSSLDHLVGHPLIVGILAIAAFAAIGMYLLGEHTLPLALLIAPFLFWSWSAGERVDRQRRDEQEWAAVEGRGVRKSLFARLPWPVRMIVLLPLWGVIAYLAAEFFSGALGLPRPGTWIGALPLPRSIPAVPVMDWLARHGGVLAAGVGVLMAAWILRRFLRRQRNEGPFGGPLLQGKWDGTVQVVVRIP